MRRWRNRGKDWHREKFYENQKTDNIWVCKDIVVFQFKHFPADKVTAMPVDGSISPAKGGSGPDFPELGWVDQNFFVGTVIYQRAKVLFLPKSKCQAFIGQGRSGTQAPSTATVSAWIDAKTRLPVAVEDGDLLKTYTYRAGPAAIQPTGVFAEAFNRAVVAI